MSEVRADQVAGDDSLAEMFWAVTRRLRHSARTTVEPLGVTPGHARALGTLGRHGPMRLGALSEHLRIAARSATEVVDALEERALVARTPDPADRRATLVALTPAGAELVGRIKAARAAEAQALFGVLSDQDRAELTRILATLRDT